MDFALATYYPLFLFFLLAVIGFCGCGDDGVPPDWPDQTDAGQADDL